MTAVGVGGMLGGHLAYRQAAGANHAEEVPHLVGEGWHRIGGAADFPVGQAVRRSVDDEPILVVHQPDGEIHALADRCSHLAGPLSEGTIADGCVACPWHGSVFRLSDGYNVRGPATAPQPAFDTRMVDGHLEVRLRRHAGEDGGDPADRQDPGDRKVLEDQAGQADQAGRVGDGTGPGGPSSGTGTEAAHGHGD
jgi:nitrite reductase/ring-hydroxylating ferredoxin subunit